MHALEHAHEHDRNTTGPDNVEPIFPSLSAWHPGHVLQVCRSRSFVQELQRAVRRGTNHGWTMYEQLQAGRLGGQRGCACMHEDTACRCVLASQRPTYVRGKEQAPCGVRGAQCPTTHVGAAGQASGTGRLGSTSVPCALMEGLTATLCAWMLQGTPPPCIPLQDAA